MSGDKGPSPKQPESLSVVQGSSSPESVPQGLLRDLLALERGRIENEQQRNDLARRAIDAKNAADERQYRYHTEKLRHEAEDGQTLRRFGMRLVWTILATGIVFVGSCLGFLFFGNEDQRTSAMYVLLVAFTIGGGYGLIQAMRLTFRGLFRR